MDTERLLTIKEISELLGGVDRKTVRRMVRRGEWPAPIKVGHQWFWRPSTVKEYLAALEVVQRVQNQRGTPEGVSGTAEGHSGPSEDSGQKAPRRTAKQD